MANGYDDYDQYDYGMEADPMEQAAAAAMLADEMRREEESLSRIGRGVPYSPAPSPVSRPALAGPGIEDWRSYVKDMVSSRGLIPMAPTVDFEAQAASEQARAKYEAQKMYNFLVSNGMTPAAAMAQSGAGMFGSSGITASKPMSEYQQAQIQRWQKPPDLTPYQEAQIGRWKEQDIAKASQMPRHLQTEYTKLLTRQEKAVEGGDPGEQNQARFAIEAFQKKYPQYFGMSETAVPKVSPPTSTGTRPMGAPYPDGTRLRKKDGSIWVVRGGVPVRQ